MERNIGEQLNKAFEAYRQASIEKDGAKRELQQKTESYERYIQQLLKQIEDQKQKIFKLEAQLISNPSTGEVKCEEETALPVNHLLDNTPFRRSLLPPEVNMEPAVATPQILPVNSRVEKYEDVLEAFEDLQGNFHQIQTLTRRQKDHLKRFYRGNDMTNEQQFSMPIQCTDGTADGGGSSVPSGLHRGLAPQPPRVPLAPLDPRGADQEDRDLDESLTKLSVKFPPSTDSEYEFLNSTPDRQVAHLGLAHLGLSPGKRPAVCSIATVLDEEMSGELSAHFSFPTSSSAPRSPAHSHSHLRESVRGPQQPLWSPVLCCEEAPQGSEEEGHSSPSDCAFCHEVVPPQQWNSHLYSHFNKGARN
ncbi:TRAF family member-associated NF-kappa-B activator isoform X1 [Osmerus eperlanus]|uniref:TRAF family member-associated NF-kappa-B activator isoform X1 n=1 Tax=Osmerus eperlanus TaxID=29151 RepID=UPI002E0DA45A